MLSWMAYDEPPTERELGQSTSNRRHTKKDVSGNDRYGRSQRGMSRCAWIRRRSPRVRLRPQTRRNGVDIEMTYYLEGPPVDVARIGPSGRGLEIGDLGCEPTRPAPVEVPAEYECCAIVSIHERRRRDGVASAVRRREGRDREAP